MNLLLFPIRWFLSWVLLVVAFAYWVTYLFLPLWILIALGFWVGVFPIEQTRNEVAGWIVVMICMGLSSLFMTTKFPNPYPEWLGEWYSKMSKWVDF